MTPCKGLRVLPEFDHEEIFARFGYTMEWLDNSADRCAHGVLWGTG